MARYTIDQAKLLARHRFEQVVDALVTTQLVKVRSRTPIDTGNARSRWTRTPEGLAAMGTTFVVGNDAEYIVALEYGHSKQAPAGMARITAAEAQQDADAICARFNA